MMRSLRSASFVPMVKAADLWNAHDTPLFWWLDGSGVWCVFQKRQVAAAPVIILEKSSEMTRQAVLIQDDHMIQALPANGSDHPFHISALPRRCRCR
jgi:hypothetical protein